MEEKLDWRWPPLVVLETEEAYPGLMSKLAILKWQKDLIEKQMSGTGELTDG